MNLLSKHIESLNQFKNSLKQLWRVSNQDKHNGEAKEETKKIVLKIDDPSDTRECSKKSRLKKSNRERLRP